MLPNSRILNNETNKNMCNNIQTYKTGFTKFFTNKKKDNKFILEDDMPHIRPISQQSLKVHDSIPLAPPPLLQQQNATVDTISLPLERPSKSTCTFTDARRLSVRKSSDSISQRSLQLRKSTGSLSMYSTFDGGSNSSLDSNHTFFTVCSHPQSDTDDEFVDAVSHMEKRLSKRMSGNYVGSAGGLVVSISAPPDAGLTKSMLDWSHFAKTLDDLTADPIDLTTPTIEKQEEIVVVKQQETTDEVKTTAAGLWNNNESIVSKEKMAEWLGQAKPFEQAVLNEYMQFFKLEEMTLDAAFRTLCKKLYFKAEAQQIDRILESFANRYWQCNPYCIYRSADIVYAVVYSLLLLNTDLHVVQGNHARMTRNEFIQNTMSTLRDHDTWHDKQWETEIENELKELYLSVKHYQILQPSERVRRTNSLLVGRRLKRSVSSMIHGTKTSAPELGVTKETPYKEGLVMRKHLLSAATQKAKHREWRACWLEIGMEGELRMYATPSIGDKSLFRQSSMGTELLGKVPLNHSLANCLPSPGYNRNRPYVFALQQADGGVYLFQVNSAEQATAWVSTCNYWAARDSKEPLAGAMGNMEYGWGEGTDIIHDWVEPQPSMVSSRLGEEEQLDQLQKYLKKLNMDMNHHREIKRNMMIKFPRDNPNYSKVMNNWETRSNYLLHEIIKYQQYCEEIEKSIQSRRKNKISLFINSSNLFDELNQQFQLFEA